MNSIELLGLSPTAGFDLQHLCIAFVPIRETPKGTYVDARGDGVVALRFKAVIRFWWMLPYILMTITVFLAVPLGFLLGSAFLPFTLLALTVISYWLTHPWVLLVADAQCIKIGLYYFDRTKYGGMRLGYEIKSGDNVLKNDFHDISLGKQALRISYGLWGEDLPYLVNSYHANAIVIWLNYMIASTIPKPTDQANIATGQRPQNF